MAPPTAKDYKSFLNSKTVPFPCPECKSSVLPKDFEEHYVSHGLITQLSCAWCLGKTSWRSRLNIKHLMDCSTKFLSVRLGRDFHPRAYEPLWPMPLTPNRLTFQPESLNTAVSCFRMFLMKKTYWAQVIVKAADFPKFLEAMDADKGRTQTLPFFSWCDGGEDAEERHRHIIIVAPSRKHLERNVWAEAYPIDSPMKLINVLPFLSQRETACPYSSDQKVYYVSESLPVGYKVLLAMQWEKGLESLLNQEMVMKVIELAEYYPAGGEGPSLNAIVKDVLYSLPKIPVTADFYPCSYPTEYFVYKQCGEKFYYDRLPS